MGQDRGSNHSYGTVFPMPAPNDAPGPELDLIMLPRGEAVAAVQASWDAARAVCVVDPATPAAVVKQLLARLRPHAVITPSGRARQDNPLPNDSDFCAVVATSGTSGAPKLVELSRGARDAAATRVNRALKVTASDRWLITMPIGSVAALAIIARARLSGCAIEVHDAFDPHATVASHSSLVSLVPTQLRRCADIGLGSFRAVLLGGASAPSDLAVDWPVHRTYGSTETWGGIVHDGTPLEGVQVRVAPNTKEIELTSPTLFTGYRGDPAGTAARFTTDGWYRTGDVGALNGAGTLSVNGRLDDMIITGGHKVSPHEVEDALRAQFDLSDVAVIGCPDREWGEHVHAVIQMRPGTTAPSLEFVRSVLPLERHKLPQQLSTVDELPRNSAGKVAKLQLRVLFGCNREEL